MVDGHASQVHTMHASMLLIVANAYRDVIEAVWHASSGSHG